MKKAFTDKLMKGQLKILLYDDKWLSLASSQRDCNSWVYHVMKDLNGAGDIYLKTLRTWFDRFPSSNKKKKGLKKELENFENVAHLGRVNELSWWELMKLLGWSATPNPGKGPDFHITKPEDFFCEVTTLNVSEEDEELRLEGKLMPLKPQKTIGRIVRKIVIGKLDQIKQGASKKKPSVLVIFDYTEWSGYGIPSYLALANYLFGEQMGSVTLPPELSAIIWIKRFVEKGKIVIDAQLSAAYHNPRAPHKLSKTIFQIIRQYALLQVERPPDSPLISGWIRL